MEYSNDMNYIYNSIEEYNPRKEWKELIVFDDMIADIVSDKKLHSIVTELVFRGQKLNISLVFHHTIILPPKDLSLNTTHLFIMNIPNKKELQQIATNHSSNADFKEFNRLYKECTVKKYSFLFIDNTLP